MSDAPGAKPTANQRILFLTLYPAIGASSRYRVYQFLPHLAAHGIRYTVSPLLSERYFRVSMGIDQASAFERTAHSILAGIQALLRRTIDVFRSPAYDIIFIQKDVLPFGLVHLLKFLNPRIVYDIDDVIYLPHPNARGLVRWLMDLRSRAFNRMPAISRAVIVENDFIGSHVARFCPKVVRLTGPIDTERFRPAHKPISSNKVIIGWIGAPSTAYNLKICHQALRRVCARHPEVEVLIIGCPTGFTLEGVRTHAEPWAYGTEVKLLQEMDIGVMPLEDEEWNRGKGGTKLLQYMATGLPCVASPVEINREIVAPDVTGFLPADGVAWEDALERLVTDAGLRRRLGSAGREKAARFYSLDRAVATWCALFAEVTGLPRPPASPPGDAA